MKTTIKLLTIILAFGFSVSCSSSLHVSSLAPANNDGIYHYADGSSEKAPNSEVDGSEMSDMEALELKYKAFLDNESSASNDTVLYNSANENPYDKLLVDSYQEAYERRLAARSNPYYGMNNWAVRYSSDYWYASAYDPSFYNVFAVGDSVWVEPTWVSNMFGGSFYTNHWLNRYNDLSFMRYNRSYYYHFGHYMGPGLYSGYNYGYEYYGRRPGFSLVNFNSRVLAGASISDASVSRVKRDLANRQVTLGKGVSVSKNRHGLVGSSNMVASISSRRKIQDPDKKESNASISRAVVEPNRDKNNNILSTNRVNISRSEAVSGEVIKSTRRRSNTTSYTRPNSGNKSEFNPSKYTVPGRGNSRTNVTLTNRSRSYNPPARTTLPSVNRPVGTTSSGSRSVSTTGTSHRRSSVSTSGGSSSVSKSSGRSSAGQSSSRGSSSSSSSSSSGRSSRGKR